MIILVIMIFGGLAISGLNRYYMNIIPSYYYTYDIDYFSSIIIGKPWEHLEPVALGILIAMAKQRIEWYQKEATIKEAKRETILEWLHHTNVAPFILWVGSASLAGLSFLSFMYIDFSSNLGDKDYWKD